MRGTQRLFAALSNHLTPFAPTGLTGLLTHPYPRPALLYAYSSTLHKLAQLPETSVYRQATEALTRQRLAIVEAIEPAGFDAWQKEIEEHYIPQMKEQPVMAKERMRQLEIKGKPYLFQPYRRQVQDERWQEWDGERGADMEFAEGIASEGRRSAELNVTEEMDNAKMWEEGVEIPNEPSLTTDQINEMEQKLGAGLIEEVVEVAEREEQLVNAMLKYKVWEELEEKPVEGQWSYFQRDP